MVDRDARVPTFEDALAGGTVEDSRILRRSVTFRGSMRLALQGACTNRRRRAAYADLKHVDAAQGSHDSTHPLCTKLEGPRHDAYFVVVDIITSIGCVQLDELLQLRHAGAEKRQNA